MASIVPFLAQHKSVRLCLLLLVFEGAFGALFFLGAPRLASLPQSIHLRKRGVVLLAISRTTAFGIAEPGHDLDKGFYISHKHLP